MGDEGAWCGADTGVGAQTVRIGHPVPDHWAGLHWFVATVRGGRDYAARDALEAAGVPVFMIEGRAAKRRRGSHSNGRRLIDYPAFSGYLFVGDLEAACTALHDAPRQLVTGFVGIGMSGPCATRVGGGVMRRLFAMHESAALVPATLRDALRSRIRMGECVEITEGPMRYMKGIVQKFRTGEHVEILMEILGRETPVRIPLDSVARFGPLWQPDDRGTRPPPQKR